MTSLRAADPRAALLDTPTRAPRAESTPSPPVYRAAAAIESARVARAAYGGTTLTHAPRIFAAPNGQHALAADSIAADNDAAHWLTTTARLPLPDRMLAAHAALAAGTIGPAAVDRRGGRPPIAARAHAQPNLETLVDRTVRAHRVVLDGLVRAVKTATGPAFPDTRAVRDQMVAQARRFGVVFAPHARLFTDGLIDPSTLRPLVDSRYARRVAVGDMVVHHLTSFQVADLPYRLGAGEESVELHSGPRVALWRPYAFVDARVVAALTSDPGILKLLQSMVTLSSHDLSGHALNNNFDVGALTAWANALEQADPQGAPFGFVVNSFEVFLARTHRMAMGDAMAQAPRIRRALIKNARRFVVRVEAAAAAHARDPIDLSPERLTDYLVGVYFKHLFFLLPPTTPELADVVARYPHIGRNVRFHTDVHDGELHPYGGVRVAAGDVSAAFTAGLATVAGPKDRTS